MTSQESVDLVAEKLDEVAPGWAEKIDPVDLDLEDPFNCIMFQVFGDYILGLHKIGFWNCSPPLPVLADNRFLPDLFNAIDSRVGGVI